MPTQLATRLNAFALALMINSAMIGGVAYLFSSRVHQQPAMTTLAQATANPSTPSI
jgi:hypothetical protein